MLWPPKRLFKGFAVCYPDPDHGALMFKRLTILTSLLALGLMLGGCSKCGFWWDEWQSRPGACKGDFPK